jgi:hypothetical protein
MGSSVLAIGDIIENGLAMAVSLFGGSSVKAPKLQMPQVQSFQIPQADLQALNQQISANTQLSDTARQSALQAINAYNQGQLSSAYAGQYTQEVNQGRQQLLQQLAAQGISQGSTQYTNAMNNFQTWSSSLKSQMLQQQISGALQTAGLSDNAIKDLESSWQTQSNINSQNNSANIQGTNAYNNAQIQEYQANLLNEQIQNQKMQNVMSSAQGALNGASSLLGGGGSTSAINPSTSQSWSDMVNPVTNATQAAEGNPVFIAGNIAGTSGV